MEQQGQRGGCYRMRRSTSSVFFWRRLLVLSVALALLALWIVLTSAPRVSYADGAGGSAWSSPSTAAPQTAPAPAQPDASLSIRCEPVIEDPQLPQSSR